jgi:hypothetical protein
MPNQSHRWVSGLIFSALVSSALAQAMPANSPKTSEMVSEGLLVNSTISTNGQIFFLNFLDFWREKPGSGRYSIEVAERASKRWGNQVWISYGQKRLFFSALPFKTDRIRSLSEQAADAGFAALMSFSLPMGSNTDPDLSGDEI